MLTKLLDSKPFLMVLAIIISICLWSYVVINDNPTYTASLNITNIEYAGLSDLTDNGFYVIGDLPASIEVKATGARNLVTKVSDEYSANIDFSGIKGAGEYSLRVGVSAPSGVTVKRVRPESIKVKVDVGKTKRVDTHLTITGKNADRYEISLIDEDISVSGPSSVIASITKFEVTVNTDDIAKTGRAMYKAKALDADGREVTNEKLTFDNIVIVNISEVKAVDVRVDETLVPESVKALYDVEISVNTSEVRLVGEKEDLEKAEAVQVDIENVYFDPSLGVQKITAKLDLPKNTSLAAGEPETVTVTVKYTAKEEETASENGQLTEEQPENEMPE